MNPHFAAFWRAEYIRPILDRSEQTQSNQLRLPNSEEDGRKPMEQR